ncbi:alpha-glucan family phosphorylase [Chloroflexota bacterium]
MVNNITPGLPKRVEGLNTLAYNLWWSWHDEARRLFKVLDRPLWKATGHNPVKLLKQIEPYKLVSASQNPTFLNMYDSVMAAFNHNMASTHTWLNVECPDMGKCTIAYFSPEFAFHNSLPIYAGGLGILAGDYCKEASDCGIPLIGIGFMYPQGYFHQHVSVEGWQDEIYEQVNYGESPITPVLDKQGTRMKVEIPLDTHTIYAAIWQVNVGRVNLYLLDNDIEDNTPQDRQLSEHLYISDREVRLQQEIMLGIGGVRAIRALGLNPDIWHANEGHTSFMMLERIRELVENGSDFSEAADMVKATSVITTHTPIPVGNDIFSLELMEKYFHNYWSSLGIDKDTFLNLGKYEGDNSCFNMTVLGLKLAEYRNGVSQLHGKVCRSMWQSLWPDSEEVPISSVTNGIHVPTWIAPQFTRLFNQYLDNDWLKKHDDTALWEKMMSVPDVEIWAVRRWLKYKLIREIKNRARKRWVEDPLAPVQALAMGALLDTEVLTLGFCRRFTDYKRSALILQDLDRLKSIINSEYKPVQIIFSGKAHPDDDDGKRLIQEIYTVAKDPEIGGRIAFVEDYDMHMARYLIHGVDVWLNTPRAPREASGTSGQKASLNGVLNLSVLDGWWCEGYNGSNGWAISSDPESADAADQDKADAEQMYHLLEEYVVRFYYDRDIHGIPHKWIQMVKEAIRSNAPLFSARRMAKEYAKLLYLPAVQNTLRVKEIEDIPVTPAGTGGNPFQPAEDLKIPPPPTSDGQTF